ncbi:MAG TPA: hypothetical protein VFS83_01655 [Ktedonobacterales bacterium]|nr:hypothetical protein [Ktedonobacterales bacterium]
MSAANPSPGANHQLGRYEIRLKGYLDARWAAWFDGLTVSHERDDTTLIQGSIIDQAALYGVLRKVRDLGLPLLSVMQVDPEQANEPDAHEDTDHTYLKKETDR